MEGEDESSDDERAQKKPVWQRILICVGWCSNEPYLRSSCCAYNGFNEQILLSIRVYGFHDNATSSKLTQIGDKIVKVNGMRILLQPTCIN